MKHHLDAVREYRLSNRLRIKATPGVLALVAVLPMMLGFGGCFQDQPVAGMHLAVTTYPDAPSRNSVLFLSDDKDNLNIPAAQSMGDPTLYGAHIMLSNPMTDQSDGYFLPAENWEALPAPAEGYRYVDVHHDKGPCEYAAVTANDRLVASCRGTDVHFMLNELHQEKLNVSLTLGGFGGTRYCAAFGGDVMRDMPETEDHAGTFLAAHAPAPTDCEA